MSCAFVFNPLLLPCSNFCFFCVQSFSVFNPLLLTLTKSAGFTCVTWSNCGNRAFCWSLKIFSSCAQGLNQREIEEGDKKGMWPEDTPLLIIFSAQCGMMRWEITKHVLFLNIDTALPPVSVWCHPQTSNSSALVITQVCSAELHSYNIMSISKTSTNAVTNFVHAVGFIWVMQCGFKRLTEKRDLAESVAGMRFKSNPLKHL